MSNRIARQLYAAVAAALTFYCYSGLYSEFTHEVLLTFFFVPPQHTLAEFAFFLFEG